jgi:hypothetical protein
MNLKTAGSEASSVVLKPNVTCLPFHLDSEQRQARANDTYD